MQEDYRKWKEQPEHYHEQLVEIRSGSNVVQRISHREFEVEKKQDFVNWKSNKIIHLDMKKDGSVDRFEMQLLPDEMFNEEKVIKLIEECQEAWKEEPKHFLDLEKVFLEEHKRRTRMSC